MRCARWFLLGGLCALLLPLRALADNGDCRSVDGLVPLCIGHAAEDIEPLPDGRHLLLSNYGGWEGTAGTLVLLDTQTQHTLQLYPSQDDTARADAGSGSRGGGSATRGFPAWGDPACTAPIGSALSPHGIHLSRRADGRLQLLVVNHGQRESVELFEVVAHNDNYRLHWRGCVTGPGGSFFNDVAAIFDAEKSDAEKSGAASAAGFVVTQMFDRNDPEAGGRTARGEDTGHVLRWRPHTGFEKVSGSSGNVPNGIQTSADGRFAFVNYSGKGELRKLDLHRGKVVGSVAIRQPDNIAWTPDGALLAVSQLQVMDFGTCAHQKTGFCNIPFAVYTVDPVTLVMRKIFEHAGAPFGAATVATQMGDTLFLGTFAGDRIARLSARPD